MYNTCRVEDGWYYFFLISYFTITVLGFLGNMSILVSSVASNVQANTRNIFILNLAVSDLVLCVVTIPLTAMDLLHHFWLIHSRMVKTAQNKKWIHQCYRTR